MKKRLSKVLYWIIVWSIILPMLVVAIIVGLDLQHPDPVLAIAGDFGSILDTELIDGNRGQENFPIVIADGVIADAYCGDGTDGWLKTYTISALGVIAFVDSLEFDATNSGYDSRPWICHVSGDVYAIVYRGAANVGTVCTVSIDSSGNIGAAIIDSYTFAAASVYNPCILPIAGTVYAIVYEDNSYYGALLTLNINADGSIDAVPGIDSWSYKGSTVCKFPILRHISGTTYAICDRQGSGATGNAVIVSLTIADDGTITKALIDTQIIAGCYGFWFDSCSGSVYGVTYGTTATGATIPHMATVTIDVAGAISAVIDDIALSADLNSAQNSCFVMSSDNSFAVVVHQWFANPESSLYTVSVDGGGGLALIDTLAIPGSFCYNPRLVRPALGIVAVAGEGTVNPDGYLVTADFEEHILPTVTSSAATAVTNSTATLHGEITDLGGYASCDFIGFVWDTSSHGDPGNVIPPATYAFNWTDSGSYGIETFTYELISLTPSETYYFRAFVHNGIGWDYSDTEQSFVTPPEDPSAMSITGSTTTSLDLSWTVGAGSNSTVVVRKIGSYPTNVADGDVAYNNTSNSFTDTPLSRSTHYFYRAWSFSNGTGYYSTGYTEDNEWTNNDLPTVTSSIATGVGNSTATLNGAIIDTGGFDDDNRGFVWDTSSHADPGDVAPAASGYASTWTEGGSFGVGVFDHAISISPGVKYYFRSCAHEPAPGGGWEYSDSEQSFTSLPCDPTAFVVIGRDAVSMSFSWINGLGATRSVIKYNVSAYPLTPYDGFLGYNDTGTSCTVESLAPGQLYYFRMWSWVAGSDVFSSGYDGTFSYTLPGIPAPFYAEQVSSSRIDLTWTSGVGSNMTVVRRRTDQYPTSYTDGSLVYNGTASTYSNILLVSGETYFYRAWSFSNISGLYSDEFGEDNADTIGNPEVTTLSATGVSVSTANMNSYISEDGGYDSSVRYQWAVWPLNVTSSNPDNMEFNDMDGTNMTMCSISDDVVAIAYRGASGNGWVATFALNMYGNFSGTAHQFIDSFEFEDTSTVEDLSIVKYPASTTYAIFCRDGATGVPKVYTVTINDKGSGFVAIDEKNLAAGAAVITKISAVYIAGDYFAVAYTGAASVGYISTVDIPSSGNMGGAPVVDTWAYESGTSDWNVLTKIYSGIYSIAYCNSTVSNVFTFPISDTGIITKSRIDELQFSASVVTYLSMCRFNGNIYAITGRLPSAAGWMYTFSISSLGAISNSVESSGEFDSTYAAYTKALPVPGGVGIFYKASSNTGVFKIFPIASNYTLSNPIATFAFNSTCYGGIDAMQVVGDEYAVTCTGSGMDGWVQCVKLMYNSWADSSSYASPYTEGESYSRTIGSLILDTEYYYRGQIYNTINGVASPRNGTAIMFRTLDQVYSPTGLFAVATSGTTISLSWDKGVGSFTTVIRYMSGSYPPTHNDGWLAYNGTGSSIVLSGLVPGTMYYFRAWGWAPGAPQWWSPSYSEDSTNTPADMAPVNPFADPGTPASWIIAASDDPPNSFYKQGVIDAANSLGMPAGTLFLILYIAISCGIGLFTYLISRSMFLCFITITCCFGGLTMMSLLPLWILVAYVLLAGGVWYMMARVI